MFFVGGNAHLLKHRGDMRDGSALRAPLGGASADFAHSLIQTA
jgi:hypothetical protein